MDDNITRNVLKFVDDTKVLRKVNNDGDKQHLQNDLDKLVKWSENWQMLFSFGKCKCLQIGYWNLDVNYKMGDIVKERPQYSPYPTTAIDDTTIQ